MDKKILKAWLKSGVIYNGKFSPTKSGTPQGGIISPTLANMVLDGLEKILKTNKSIRNRKVNLVRYADDFIITGESKELLTQYVRPVVEKFLQERGLKLSKTKTKITHIEEGFDFLGQNIRKYNTTKLLTKPSSKSCKKVIKATKAICRKHKGFKQEALIGKLNPAIRGWCNYHCNIAAKKTFSKIGHYLYWQTLRWAKRRNPKKGMKWIMSKYYKSIKGITKFAGISSKEPRKLLSLCEPAKTKIKRHIAIRSATNPFDKADRAYIIEREKKKIKN